MSPSGTVLARFDDLTAAEPTRLGVLTDLHLATDERGTWKVFHRTEDRLRLAVEGLNRAEPDAILVTGDLTRDGHPRDFDRFDEIVAALSAPLAAIPGNHDLATTFTEGPQIGSKAFAERYSPGGEGYPFRWDVGGIQILALSSHRTTDAEPADTWEGFVTAESLEWLSTELDRCTHPLVTVHHNLPGSRALYESLRDRLPVQGGAPGFANADELVDVLYAADVDVGPVLTGHLHVPAVVEYGGCREFTLPALGSFPSAYLLFEMDPEGTTVTMHSVTDLEDRVEALVHGYERDRVLLAAAQLAGCPLVDDFA